MIALWKLHRELNRIHEQLKTAAGGLVEPWLRWRHDAQRVSRLRIAQGAVAQQRKIALLLIYQPDGVASSVLLTCRHLIERGYAPLVVSNAHLSVPDQQRLNAVCWRLLQRPNFGYDFGGYRDGLWLLEREGAEPDQLLILNDSIWFPLSGGETLLFQMESLAADVVGAFAAEDRRSKQQSGRARRAFLSSFLFLVRGPVLRSDAFRAFWANYPSSNSKQRTIRRGERGFSLAMESEGRFRLQAVQHRARLDRAIDSADASTAAAVLQGLVTLDDELKVAINACLQESRRDQRWLNLANRLIHEVTDGQNYLSTAPLLCAQVLGVPYAKKSRDPQNLAALQRLVEAADSGQLIVSRTVLDEVRATLNQAAERGADIFTAPAAR